MVFETALIYSGSFLLGFGIIGLAYGLQRRIRLKFIGDYFVYLVAAVVYGFLNWIGPYMSDQIFDPAEERGFLFAILIFSTLSIPFLIIKMYFLFSFVIRWMGKRPRLLSSLGIGIFSLIISGLYAVGVRRILIRGDFNAGKGYIFIVGIASVIFQIIIRFIPLAAGLLRPGRKRNQGLFMFCLLNLIGFGSYVCAAYFGLQAVTPLLYFIVLIGPLLYVRFYLSKHPADGNSDGFSTLMDSGKSLDLTPRELEIVDLVLQGKNNRQIGRQLFLSLQSVKNALTRIYRKAGVSSRSQLMSLLMRRAKDL